jgi:hypothetical protein
MVRLISLASMLLLVGASSSFASYDVPGCSKDLAPSDFLACKMWSDAKENSVLPAQQRPTPALLRGVNGEVLLPVDTRH